MNGMSGFQPGILVSSCDVLTLHGCSSDQGSVATLDVDLTVGMDVYIWISSNSLDGSGFEEGPYSLDIISAGSNCS